MWMDTVDSGALASYQVQPEGVWLESCGEQQVDTLPGPPCQDLLAPLCAPPSLPDLLQSGKDHPLLSCCHGLFTHGTGKPLLHPLPAGAREAAGAGLSPVPPSLPPSRVFPPSGDPPFTPVIIFPAVYSACVSLG